MRIVPPEPRTNIFLIDDDDDSRDLFAEVLRRAGFAVDSFNSGEEALTQFEATRPAVVLTDISLAGSVDGIETARRIRRLDPYAALIAVTGHSLDDVKRGGMVFDSFLRKPIGLDELVAAVRYLAEEATTQTLPVLTAAHA